MRWLTIETSNAAVSANERQRIALPQPPAPWQRHLWGIVRPRTGPDNWAVITIYEERRIIHRNLRSGVATTPNAIVPIDFLMVPGRRYQLEVLHPFGGAGGIDGPPVQIAYEDRVP